MSKKIKEIPFAPSTIETIDRGLFNHIKEKMNLHCQTNEGFKPPEIIWASAERAFLTKKSKEAHDQDGTLNFPLISIERTSVVKDPTRKGTAYANIDSYPDEKGGSIVIARRIKQDKTQEFANRDVFERHRYKRGYTFPSSKDNKKVVYETISIPMPVYLDITYDIKIRTQFQQQMNQLLTPFMTRTGGINYFGIKQDGHLFEAFIQQDFALSNNISNMATEERMFETTVQVKVLGYIIGGDVNQEKPKFSIRENAVDVAFPRERVIVGDIRQRKHDVDYSGGEYVGVSSIFGDIYDGETES